MKFLKELLKFFVNITAGILIVCTIHFSASDSDTIPGSTLWQILLSGAITAFISALFYKREITTTRKFITVVVLHYFALCTVMILLGIWFGWMDFDIPGIIMMAVSVAIVYGFTFFARFLLDKKEVDEMNHALKEKYRKGED